MSKQGALAHRAWSVANPDDALVRKRTLRLLLFSIAVTLHQRERAFQDDDRAEMDLAVSRLSPGVSPAFIPLF